MDDALVIAYCFILFAIGSLVWSLSSTFHQLGFSTIGLVYYPFPIAAILFLLYQIRPVRFRK